MSRQLWITLGLALIVLVPVVGSDALLGISADFFTRDVNAIANVHPFAGAVSNLGMLLWCTAAAISAFVAVTVHRVAPRTVTAFLVASALLSGYLLFDDMFMVHEYVAPVHLGIREEAVYAFIAIASLAYLVVFRKLILASTDFFVLILAVGFLGSSIVADLLVEGPLAWLDRHWRYVLEDGLKWLGLAFWCSYHVVTGHQLLVAAGRASEPRRVAERGMELAHRL